MGLDVKFLKGIGGNSFYDMTLPVQKDPFILAFLYLKFCSVPAVSCQMAKDFM